MGQDGLRGCELIRERHGAVLAQDAASSGGLGHARSRGPRRPGGHSPALGPGQWRNRPAAPDDGQTQPFGEELDDSSHNFKFIQDFSHEPAAIVLEPGKEYLVETRLTPIARQSGFETLDDFVDRLRTDRKAVLFHEQVTDALTTNETSFSAITIRSRRCAIMCCPG
jgi:hypothetical protein